MLELPEYKVPSVRVVLSRVWEASQAFVIRAGTLIFAASIVIWFAGYWPGDHARQYELQTQLEIQLPESSRETESLEAELATARVPACWRGACWDESGTRSNRWSRPLGWDWKIGVGAVASFPAREVIIATLGTIYSLGGDADEEGLVGAIRASDIPGRIARLHDSRGIIDHGVLCPVCPVRQHADGDSPRNQLVVLARPEFHLHDGFGLPRCAGNLSGRNKLLLRGC